MTFLGPILDWLLYARVSYYGSHLSANVLLIGAGLIIWAKIWKRRKALGQFSGKRILLLPGFFIMDGFFSAYFPGSLHEAIFQPLFVGSTLLWHQVPFASYVYEWTHDVNIWRSLCIEWASATFFGLAWWRGNYRFRLGHWIPFILVILVWIAIQLPVSLPFPTTETSAPWCQDCLVPNGFEFLYNLTFTIAIVQTFNYPLLPPRESMTQPPGAAESMGSRMEKAFRTAEKLTFLGALAAVFTLSLLIWPWDLAIVLAYTGYLYGRVSKQNRIKNVADQLGITVATGAGFLWGVTGYFSKGIRKSVDAQRPEVKATA